MKTVVLIKQVPETSSSQIDETTGTVKRSAADAIVNPLDLYAVETAILLRDHFGGTITAFSMGPKCAIDALREVVAMGVDRGVLVSDRDYAGSDTWATSNILAQAIRFILPKFDLILCGQRATDGETGQVGPETACALGIPVITYVDSIEETHMLQNTTPPIDSNPKSKSRTLHLTRNLEDGCEHIHVSFPVLLTIDKTSVSPRLPTLSGKIKAKTADIKILSQSELKLPPEQIGLTGSPTSIVRIFRPQWSRSAQIEHPSNDESLNAALTALDSMLHAKGLS